MFRSYDHHEAEKYIATLGLLNWQRIRCFIRSHIILYRTQVQRHTPKKNVAHNNGVSNDSQQNIDNNNNVRSYETTDPLSIE
jgi:hypothetical protein